MIKRPQGTHDLVPNSEFTKDPENFYFIEKTAKDIFDNAFVKRIDTPIFEELKVVEKGVGDGTDIVKKEMFYVSYADKNKAYVLRPEATAPIMRAYLQNGLKQMGVPLKLWTFGPMFRAERPQKGRYRQFNQISYECIGATEACADAEAITIMYKILTSLGLKDFEIKIGSIGDLEDRIKYNEYLKRIFLPFEKELSQDSKDRLQRNPVRILDSKAQEDIDIINKISPKPIFDFLGEEARKNFDEVINILKVLEIPFVIDKNIVRGLDYYRRTAWEVHSSIGAKSALGGGGRYDSLSASLGAKENIPSVGFGLGIERILIALEQENANLQTNKKSSIYFCAMDLENVSLAAKLTFMARQFLSANFSYKKRNAKQAFTEADSKGFNYCALIGSLEVKKSFINVKNLATSEQIKVNFDDLDEFFKKISQ